VTSIDELGEAVSMYVARASEKLRGQQSLCGAIHVFIQTNPFRQQDEQYSNGLTIAFPEPSDDSRTLAGAALQGLRAIYRPGYRYKKAGVMLMNLSPNSVTQGSLFDSPKPWEETATVMAALDALNRRYGRDTLVLGSAGTGGRWAMKAGNKTARRLPRSQKSAGGQRGCRAAPAHGYRRVEIKACA